MYHVVEDPMLNKNVKLVEFPRSVINSNKLVTIVYVFIEIMLVFIEIMLTAHHVMCYII